MDSDPFSLKQPTKNLIRAYFIRQLTQQKGRYDVRHNQHTIQAVPEIRKALKRKKQRIRVNEHLGFSLDKLYRPRIRLKQLAQFTRQLGTLVEARFPLTRSIEILSKQTVNKRFQSVMKGVLLQIEAGQPLSSCLRNQPTIFDSFYVSMVRVGEQAGILGETLSRLALYLEKMAALRRKVLTALTYPFVIVLVAGGAMAFLLVAVVPTFADMFQDFGSQLPGPTQFLLDLSNFLKSNFLYLFGLGLLLAGTLFRIRKFPRVSYRLDKISLRVPFVGTLAAKSFLAKFCRTLGTLLESGVSLTNSLEVTEMISRNQVLQNAIQSMQKRITRGRSLIDANHAVKPFTPLTIQMIQVGEETGELGSMLIKVARFYEEELDATIDALTSIIEPVIIVFLGLALGGTLIAMYLQLFNLVNVIQ